MGPTKDHLLREALSVHTSTLVVPDTGTWAGDVRAMAHTCATFFSDPVEVSQNAIMASGRHADYVTTVVEHYEPFLPHGESPSIEPDNAARSVPTPTQTPCSSPSQHRSSLLSLLFRTTARRAQLDHIVDTIVRGTASST